uniref:Uncharacterized protein n=1 Tax=Panagrolaimus superbus TaxID=310955 RepID=A0A914Z888_9BILA
MPAEIDTSPPEKHVQSLPVVGSFYLRFGAFIFAIVACVYYIFSAHWGIFTAVDICAIIFTIFQTHLLFFSSTMFDEKVYIISCFGTMHLVAVNLITWVQFLFAKNQSTEESIAKYFKKKKNVTDKIITGITTTISSLNSNEEDFEEFQRSVPSNSRSRIPYNSECKGLECVFGLLWGLLFVIGTALSMIFFYVNWYHDEHKEAAYNFNITDIVQNGIGMIACIFAFWRLRLLDFAHHSSHDPHHDIHANQELLDMILLAIGIIGELAFSISGLAGICSNKAWNTLTILLAIARILRIIQSIFQTFLIAFASKLKSTDPDRHPGRQTITFLIILNMAMFIYQWFISDKAGTYEGVISLYGEESWAFFVSIFSPLTVFFRFHSSVCFVEIWKHTYAKLH